MQRSGTEAIRTPIQPSKPKREITNITNSQNTKTTYGQPSEQIFPKRWPLSNRNRTKNQRTNGPVNAHLIYWPSKAQNIQNLENIWSRNDLDLQYSHTIIISISCLHLPTLWSQAAIVSENPLFSLFPIEKSK